MQEILIKLYRDGDRLYQRRETKDGSVIFVPVKASELLQPETSPAVRPARKKTTKYRHKRTAHAHEVIDETVKTRVKDLYIAGRPLARIGRELGRSSQAVARLLTNMRKQGVDLPYRCVRKAA